MQLENKNNVTPSTINMTDHAFPSTKCFRQQLHGTESVWNRYEIGTDKPCVYTGPAGSGTDRICYLVPHGSTYEGDLMWNHTVPVQNWSFVNRVDPISNGSEYIQSCVNVALEYNKN